MHNSSRLGEFRHGRKRRPNSEQVQSAIRLVIVSSALLYFFSGWFAASSAPERFVYLARWGVSIAFITSLALIVTMLVSPRPSIIRRITGLVHDIAAISVALYLGESAAAGLAVIYLWVTLGNGFRYSNVYLFSSAAMSLASFSAVIWFSDYWHAQMTLSLTILAVIALIPPYVGALLSSLRRAREQLRQQASIDLLTGLLNRVETEMTMERLLDERHDGHALLFCDLDLFKRVNDDAGHAAGDKLLADVARIITDCTSGKDIVGRLGGDEFCVLLVDASMERARCVSEDIRNRVSGYRLAWGRDYYSVGISIGVAPTVAVRDLGSLFRLADAACYAAKNAGRNQVHIVDPRTGLADTQRIRKLFSDNAMAATTRIEARPAGGTS